MRNYYPILIIMLMVFTACTTADLNKVLQGVGGQLPLSQQEVSGGL